MESNLIKIISNLMIIRFWNFLFALAGLLLFMFYKDSENEQLFFVFSMGFLMVYNLVRLLLLTVFYQTEKEKQSTFTCSRKTGAAALSNNIPDIMEGIRRKEGSNNEGKI